MAETETPSKIPRIPSPLWVISLFVALTETVVGIAVTQTSGGIQVALTTFVLIFPLIIAVGFFAVLWFRPYAFYPPSEYGDVGVQEYVEALKGGSPDQLVTKTADTKEMISRFGNPDRLKLLFKAESRAWSKSTKAMEVGNGCIVQVSSKQLTPAGWQIAEAVAYIPGVVVHDELEGDGRYLAPAQTVEK